MSKEDIIQHQVRTAEEAQKLGALGGKKSGEVRRKKRDAKMLISALLESQAPETLKKGLQKLFPEIEPKTIEECMNLSMVKHVVKGNVQAYNALLDRVDGKPNQPFEGEVKNININIAKEIAEKNEPNQ